MIAKREKRRKKLFFYLTFFYIYISLSCSLLNSLVSHTSTSESDFLPFLVSLSSLAIHMIFFSLTCPYPHYCLLFLMLSYAFIPLLLFLLGTAAGIIFDCITLQNMHVALVHLVLLTYLLV